MVTGCGPAYRRSRARGILVDVFGGQAGAMFNGFNAEDLGRLIEGGLRLRSWRVRRAWFGRSLIVGRGRSPSIKIRFSDGPGRTVSLRWKPILDVPWSESPVVWNAEGSVRAEENANAFVQRVLFPELTSMFPGRVLVL